MLVDFDLEALLASEYAGRPFGMQFVAFVVVDYLVILLVAAFAAYEVAAVGAAVASAASVRGSYSGQVEEFASSLVSALALP